MVAVVDEIVNGTFKAQSYVYGVAEGCSGFVANETVYDKAVSAEGQAAVDAMYKKLQNKEVDIFDFINEYLPAVERAG